jgi:phosphoribosyl 1,2-cyclic phosphodiesterase
VNAASAAAPATGQAAGQPATGHPAQGTHLILLGTKGGPTPSDLRAAPSNVLVVDGQPYVVDCGNGVALQLTKAGIKLPGLRDIFLTHHHSDHNADLGNLVFLAWATGLHTPVNLYGPPRITRMIDDFVDMNAIDLEVRMREEGRPAFRPLINIHEFDGPRLVMEDERVKVTSMLVDHYTIKPAFAYRFETRDRTVVFSGDTTYYPPACRVRQRRRRPGARGDVLARAAKADEDGRQRADPARPPRQEPHQHRTGRKDCRRGRRKNARIESFRARRRPRDHGRDVGHRRTSAFRWGNHRRQRPAGHLGAAQPAQRP